MARSSRSGEWRSHVFACPAARAPALFADFEIYLADDKQDAARVAYHKV